MGARPARARGRRLGWVLLSAAMLLGLLGLALFHFRLPNTHTVAVPDVIGLTAEQAKAALAVGRAGLAVEAARFPRKRLLAPGRRAAARGGPFGRGRASR